MYYHPCHHFQILSHFTIKNLLLPPIVLPSGPELLDNLSSLLFYFIFGYLSIVKSPLRLFFL